MRPSAALIVPSATLSVAASTPSFFAGEIEQDRAHLGAGERSASPPFSIDWLPAVMPSFGVLAVSPEISVSSRERQVELFGGDLRERGQDALAELDLAGEYRGGAVGVDAEPRIEHAVGVQAAGQRRRGAWREQLGRIEREGEHDAAQPLRKSTALRHGSVHGQVLPISRPARITAPTIRL